ncbi:hypothetical protein DK880_00359 [Candidatus Cardinium hertigii]|uniref:Uncharacterized protein n=1 Tax=Candidatus Cardinium hertigii TaxID=247481 RepID=A0A2Z3L8C2_9BACT|nr:hypothetical protein DK880_00359 [Candidatus Cardinium hertigii]
MFIEKKDLEKGRYKVGIGYRLKRSAPRSFILKTE